MVEMKIKLKFVFDASMDIFENTNFKKGKRLISSQCEQMQLSQKGNKVLIKIINKDSIHLYIALKQELMNKQGVDSGRVGQILGDLRIYPGVYFEIYPRVDSEPSQNLPGYKMKGGIIWGLTPANISRWQCMFQFQYCFHFGYILANSILVTEFY